MRETACGRRGSAGGRHELGRRQGLVLGASSAVRPSEQVQAVRVVAEIVRGREHRRVG
jgi:hypothetical protein